MTSNILTQIRSSLSKLFEEIEEGLFSMEGIIVKNGEMIKIHHRGER